MSEALAAHVVDDRETAPSPALERLARATHAVCGGILAIRLDDMILAVEECTYQAARILRAEGRVEIPNIGRLEIRYGDDGPVGRFVPSADLHPCAVLVGDD
jgi:hypothetical protein